MSHPAAHNRNRGAGIAPTERAGVTVECKTNVGGAASNDAGVEAGDACVTVAGQEDSRHVREPRISAPAVVCHPAPRNSTMVRAGVTAERKTNAGGAASNDGGVEAGHVGLTVAGQEDHTIIHCIGCRMHLCRHFRPSFAMLQAGHAPT